MVHGNKVYTTNPGSHTVVVFEIDAADPIKLHLTGQLTNSGSEFPVSYLHAKRCCRPYPRSIPLSRIEPDHPATGAFGTVSQVVFNQDKTKLLVAVKGIVATRTPGYIAIWDVAPSSLPLSRNTSSASTFWILKLLPLVQLSMSIRCIVIIILTVVSNSYLYVLSVGSRSVEVLSLAGGSGKAAIVQEYAFGSYLAADAIPSDTFEFQGFATYIGA
ncbi:hypothetical protein M422DRAFT_250319 [Sphaerobolus stellatus SS14]|uniref:Unplaced genomic scaffold SPHSTscaffold_33, whole genome shotgun sequence n=1 Tax=Sphaerobolus stellatus (strain SS14) TaxID=990650 RepID=A0A0C9W3C1_SPHS4|nr:hypothetical protein M422DRAFT_250319 [Sphaerobolus stellatus SS14]